jgi:hypothetical protein
MGCVSHTCFISKPNPGNGCEAAPAQPQMERSSSQSQTSWRGGRGVWWSWAGISHPRVTFSIGRRHLLTTRPPLLPASALPPAPAPAPPPPQQPDEVACGLSAPRTLLPARSNLTTRKPFSARDTSSAPWRYLGASRAAGNNMGRGARVRVGGSTDGVGEGGGGREREREECTATMRSERDHTGGGGDTTPTYPGEQGLDAGSRLGRHFAPRHVLPSTIRVSHFLGNLPRGADSKKSG